jgi:hypothetical protein
MSYQPFVYQTIGNGVLRVAKAMPQKDINSNGDSDFAQSREQYVRSQNAVPVSNAVKNQKKWMGNRDSSSVTERRRFNAVGKSSINATNQPIAFSQHNDINTTSDALRRVRSGGYVTNPAVRAKLGNNLTPHFPVAALVRTQNQGPAIVYGDPVHGQPNIMLAKQPINNFIPVLTDTGLFNRVQNHHTSNTQPVLYH